MNKRVAIICGSALIQTNCSVQLTDVTTVDCGYLIQLWHGFTKRSLALCLTLLLGFLINGPINNFPMIQHYKNHCTYLKFEHAAAKMRKKKTNPHQNKLSPPYRKSGARVPMKTWQSLQSQWYAASQPWTLKWVKELSKYVQNSICLLSITQIHHLHLVVMLGYNTTTLPN